MRNRKQEFVMPALGLLWERLEPLGYAITRWAAGFVFVVHGAARLRLISIGGPTVESTGQFISKFGIQPGLAWSYYVTVLELIGGLLLLLGLLTRPVAALFVGFMVVGTFYVTIQLGFFARDGGFEYSLVLLALCVSFLIRGGGELSLDHIIGREV